jgi:hypothetical protein
LAKCHPLPLSLSPLRIRQNRGENAAAPASVRRRGGELPGRWRPGGRGKGKREARACYSHAYLGQGLLEGVPSRQGAAGGERLRAAARMVAGRRN